MAREKRNVVSMLHNADSGINKRGITEGFAAAEATGDELTEVLEYGTGEAKEAVIYPASREFTLQRKEDDDTGADEDDDLDIDDEDDFDDDEDLDVDEVEVTDADIEEDFDDDELDDDLVLDDEDDEEDDDVVR